MDDKSVVHGNALKRGNGFASAVFGASTFSKFCLEADWTLVEGAIFGCKLGNSINVMMRSVELFVADMAKALMPELSGRSCVEGTNWSIDEGNWSGGSKQFWRIAHLVDDDAFKDDIVSRAKRGRTCKDTGVLDMILGNGNTNAVAGVM